MDRQGQHALALFQYIAQRLDDKLKTPIKAFFIPLLLGVLLAIARRRTVTQWIQAAGLSEKYRNIFYHMPDIGRKSKDSKTAKWHKLSPLSPKGRGDFAVRLRAKSASMPKSLMKPSNA